MLSRRSAERWRSRRNLSIVIPKPNISQILRTPPQRRRSPMSPRSPPNIKKKLFSTSSDGNKILSRKNK